MKNKILLCLFIFLNSISQAQISGDSIVCSGYIYNYSVNIPGAVSYTWTLPSGWYNLSGQGTSSISATCNINDGDICVEGFDASSNSLGTLCITTQWGSGGGAGWDIYPSSFYFCPGQNRDVHFMIIPDTTVSGNCPAGCGNGIQVNQIYGLYDSSIPYPQFIAEVDGSWITMPPVVTTYHVYYVDVSAGNNFPDAVVISGGCGAAANNNTVTTSEAFQFPPTFIQSPDPVCIGDTVLITQTNNSVSNISWNVFGGTLISYPDTEEILLVVNSASAYITYDGYDEDHFCFLSGGPYQFPLNVQSCVNSITGDSIVCAGNIYNYTVTIPGAVSYVWTLPPGWYGLTGQGTSSITANCNVNTGNICVEGFDASSNSLGTQCITTQWGNGGAGGWDVSPQVVNFCPGDGTSAVFEIIPNGTGSGNCPAGCGNGSLHPNLIYGLYDNIYPSGHLLGVVTGASITLPFMSTNMYVYFVDTTLGSDFPDAIIINGGCGNAVANNVVIASVFSTGFPAFVQIPNPACVGDTVLVTQMMGNVYNLNWLQLQGLTIIGYPSPEEVLVVIQSSPATVIYNGGDASNGCPVVGYYNIDLTCGPPVADFSAGMNPICPGSCTNFTNTSLNSNNYLWSFTGGNPSSSTDINPSGICYNVPGNYDVQLIATNAAGTDTLLLSNYITVLPYPPPLSINQIGDTLISSPGFVSYQWYYNGNTIAGATDYFYVASQNGDYNLIAVDSNVCEVEAAIFNVFTGLFPALSKGELDVKLFPNPVKGELSISLPFTDENIKIRILNLFGESVYEIPSNKISREFTVNLRSLQSSLYILEITKGSITCRSRFVKE